MPLSRISSPSIQNFSVEAQDFANNSIETYTSSSGRPLTNRNLIINGAMQIAQRATSSTGITTENYYTADRWFIAISSAGTWTMNVDSSGPTNTEFRKSANVVCTTADSSLAAGDNFRFLQRIEGQNLQSIKKGTSAAESLTVSFWVKSSNTGTYICEFFDSDNSRQISKSYTIDAANTWEKKTITVPPDTTGQFDNDNGISLQLHFWLAAGTTFTSGALNSSAWASSVNANRTAGQLNLANASGNYWALTGVQLETGTVATPFEMRNIGQELALCQRYYYKIIGNDSSRFGLGYVVDGTRAYIMTTFPTTMRTSPTAVEQTGTAANYGVLTGVTSTTCSAVPSFHLANEWLASTQFTVASGLTAAQSITGRPLTSSVFLAWSAEL
jgi:hypothetical protein